MTMEHHERRFSPDKMARLDDPDRQRSQPPAAICQALELIPGTVVADLGVGTGFFALPIAAELKRLGGGGKVVGLDVAPRMLEEVGRRADASSLEQWIELRAVSGAGDMPLADGSLDRILSVNTVHELDDRPRVWREFWRMLRPGGFVLLVDWKKEGPFDKGPPADHRVATAEIEAELQGAGFETTRVELYESFYCLRAARRAEQ